jgi:hypothetical protein
MDRTGALKQIDDILARIAVLLGRFQYADRSDMTPEAASEAVALMTSAIERLAPPNSSYHKNAKFSQVSSYFQASVNPLIGVVKALRVAYEMDYFQSIQELIHADMFANFLDMADHLLEQNYKDAAAVLCGSVLEEHLRTLSTKNGLPVLKPDGSPKKTEMLNSELASSNVYSKLDLKNVTAWLDLRNKAAHGHYADYTKEQVDLMSQSIRDFVSRNPA